MIRREVVSRSFARLREQRIHTLFSGYLHLQQRSARLGRLDDLQPEFLAFFQRFFQVRDHPLGTPFIKPFTEQTPTGKNLWLNVNVAGSYAPSSLRPNQPFRKVVEVSGKTYSLPEDHAKRAFKHLLAGQRIPAAELAVFLYRDYGMIDPEPTIFDLIATFAYEFGYSSGTEFEPSPEFWMLYDVERTSDSLSEDWLVEL